MWLVSIYNDSYICYYSLTTIIISLWFCYDRHLSGMLRSVHIRYKRPTKIAWEPFRYRCCSRSTSRANPSSQIQWRGWRLGAGFDSVGNAGKPLLIIVGNGWYWLMYVNVLLQVQMQLPNLFERRVVFDRKLQWKCWTLSRTNLILSLLAASSR